MTKKALIGQKAERVMQVHDVFFVIREIEKALQKRTKDSERNRVQ